MVRAFLSETKKARRSEPVGDALHALGNKKAPPGFPVGLCLVGFRLIGYLVVQIEKSCIDE